MRDDIWYREELEALRDLAMDALPRADTDEQRLALAYLAAKAHRAMKTAPSGRTPEGSA